MRIISGPIWLAPFPEIIDKLRNAMKDNSTDVGGQNMWPKPKDDCQTCGGSGIEQILGFENNVHEHKCGCTIKERPVVHFERLIRQLEAQGYTDAEIEGGLQQIVHDEFKGK